MLTKLEEKQQECSFLYWSDLESRLFGDITIELLKKKEEVDYLHRQFKISHSEVRPTIQPLVHVQCIYNVHALFIIKIYIILEECRTLRGSAL